MKSYLQARRLSILQQRCRQPTKTSFSHRNAYATDQPAKNKELLDFLTTAKNEIPTPKHIKDIHAPQTPLQQQLPQSPLTDPVLTAARLRYRKEKPKVNPNELSKFQTKLRKNPYAQTLAAPLRQCALTGARLPSSFLLPFGLATHPKTGQRWHLPRLASEDARKLAGDQSPVGRAIEPGAEGANKGHGAPGPRTLSSNYFLSSARAMRTISSKKRKKEYQMLFSHRWKEDPGINVKQIVWREDMEGFVLGLLRKKVLKGLGYLAGKASGYVVPCPDGWREVQEKEQVACVLWFGGVKGDETAAEEAAASSERDDQGSREPRESQNHEEFREAAANGWKHEGPPAYAMVRYNNRFIPVYNMQKLLGVDHVKELQEGNPDRYGKELAVMKSKNRTTQVQQDLWRLMGYLSTEGQWQ